MVKPVAPDFLLKSYAYELPADRVAQQPAPDRAGSRLMTLDRADGKTRIGSFPDILTLLPANCLLVANNSRVIPARMWGKRPGGGKVEFLLLTPPPLLQTNAPDAPPLPPDWRRADADALLRPIKRIQPGDVIRFSEDFAVELLEHGDFGRCRVRLIWQGEILGVLKRHGVMPLPPYIRRPEGNPESNPDAERYQTVYCRDDKAGSVAAPTAGLHFTQELRSRLTESGREWAEVTLYVGYGTFSPVRCEDIRKHAMHAEYMELPENAAKAVARAKKEGRPVIAVGTTSARVLEGAFAAQFPDHDGTTAAPPLRPFSGQTDIFLYPGRPFNVIDGLLTNFHLPESSLLMLVSALAGRERVLAAYRQAITEGFRFFSYGDAMLIL